MVRRKPKKPPPPSREYCDYCESALSVATHRIFKITLHHYTTVQALRLVEPKTNRLQQYSIGVWYAVKLLNTNQDKQGETVELLQKELAAANSSIMEHSKEKENLLADMEALKKTIADEMESKQA
ncbi:hypothetical protein COOONC_04373, partial [Cooperia oncophora]